MARKKFSRRPPSTRASVHQQIEDERRHLLRADAVIICIQRSLDSLSGRPDEIRLGDALLVASSLINASVSALDRVALAKKRA